MSIRIKICHQSNKDAEAKTGISTTTTITKATTTTNFHLLIRAIILLTPLAPDLVGF